VCPAAVWRLRPWQVLNVKRLAQARLECHEVGAPLGHAALDRPVWSNRDSSRPHEKGLLRLPDHNLHTVLGDGHARENGMRLADQLEKRPKHAARGSAVQSLDLVKHHLVAEVQQAVPVLALYRHPQPRR
jgi:hypothetical protein